jgi:5'-AMP-activated protein kinase catalytic alpha subunit
MLCGYLPFEDTNTQVLYKKILLADFYIPRYVSLDGKDLIKNILTVDPAKRYTIE